MDSIMLMLIAALSAFKSVTPSPIQISCEEDLEKFCPYSSFYNSTHEDAENLFHERTLSKHCKNILDDIKCKKNFLSKCKPKEVEAFSLLTDGIKDLLIDLCNENTDTRKAYRTHSPCIASIQHDYGICIMKLSEYVEPEDYSDSGIDATSKEAIIRRMCRFYEPFKSCVTEATRKQCGDSAAQLVEQFVVRMAAHAVTAKCLS